MALSSGTRLGAYEIVALLGAGGMGEVYRAKDTKLGRGVALKVLPDALVADADRIARFEREAKVLAPLVHAHIAALYGMEQHEGRHCLVMELVEGETLAERLQRGPLPIAEMLRLAQQIGEALEAAHEKGVVHRDLKPANVKITPDGAVKVLDFGLAKALENPSASSVPAANSPTLSMLATQAGIVLGTASYMSPEQAKGAAVDHRTDIFSFGVVLYEMLTCHTPFQGETAPEIMASVLVREPDLTTLPASVPARLRELIRRCLEKSPKKRWQAIGDVRVEIETIATAPPDAASPEAAVPARPLWRRALPVAGAAFAGAALATAVAEYRRPAAPAQVVRFDLPLQERQQFGGAARTFLTVSPDGSRLAYVLLDRRLMLRPLNELQARPIAGLEGIQAVQPVFSPDGQWLVFWSTTDSSLKKVAISGGSPVTLRQLAANPGGISWAGRWIVFSEPEGIMRIDENGGEPELLVAAPPGAQMAHPQLVDDGRAVLYAVTTEVTESRWDRADIVLQRLGSTERNVVISGGSAPRYVRSGHLLFMVGGALTAVRFDMGSGRTMGSPISVVEKVMRTSMSGTGSPQLAVADNGTLMFVGGELGAIGRLRAVARMDFEGRPQRLPLPSGPYVTPRLSPDGRFLAVVTEDDSRATIWVHDLSGAGPPRRLTFDGHSRSPAWTPDGRSIAFQSDREGDLGIFLQRADGTGTAERLTTAEKDSSHAPSSWSPDGRTLAFTIRSGSRMSMWAVSPTGDRKPVPLGPTAERPLVLPVFSPDGRWLAYGSNELGASAYFVFVAPYPATGTKFQLTTSATSSPVWTADGKRIFYSFADNVSFSDVQAGSTFTFSRPTDLPTRGILASSPFERQFDITRDGKQLIVVMGDSGTRTDAPPAPPAFTVVLNWIEELKARVR